MTFFFTPKYLWFISLLTIVILPNALPAQSLLGKITDENNNPVPYASVFIKEAKQGTTSNTDGVFLINLPEGNYSILFRCLGLETSEKKIEVKAGQNTLNVTLNEKPYQIAPVTIGSKNEDPAYSIVRKAIGMAPYYQNQIKEFDAEVYLKGTLKIIKLAWLIKKAMRKDPDAPKEGQIYLQESINNIHFTAPGKYDQKVKMIRSNFPGENGGSNDVMRFTNASFYQPKVGDIILPLAPYALNHYNYKYDGFSIQEDRVINRIKVIPKRKSRQLLSGYIYIADDYYNLHEVDFTVESIVGTIRIKQTFGEIDKNAWLPISHHYEINGKFMGNEGNVFYISSVKYSNIKLNTDLKTPASLAKTLAEKPVENPKPKVEKKVSAKQQARNQKNAQKFDKLMGKENLSNREMHEMLKLMDKQVKMADTSARSLEIVDPITVTVDSFAYKADSTMWKEFRPVMLTADEIKIDKTIDVKLHTAKDSSQTDTLKHKKSNILLTMLMGKTWRNKEKKQTIRFSGLFSPNEFLFNTVDGFVVGSAFSYSRKFTKTAIYLKPSVSYAFARKTPMATFVSSFTYAHKNRGVLGFNFGYTSTDFNRTTGITGLTNTAASLIFGRNYMKLFDNRYFAIYNQIDLINGLVLFTSFTYSDRRMLENNTHYTLFPRNEHWYTPNTPINKLITSENIGDNKAFIGNILISYTPFYRYRMYDNRKMMISSKYPTFKLQTKFGISGVIDSNADFINWETSISQTIRTGPSNRLSYNLIYGGFISKNNLFFNDFTHFNTQITPITLTQFKNSYQNLDYYTRSTNSAYGQAFVNYHTPYLALKYLPFLSNRMWNENLHFSSLLTKDFKPYYEVGYSMSQIGALASVGVFAGFEGNKFYSFSVKLSIMLIRFDM